MSTWDLWTCWKYWPRALDGGVSSPSQRCLPFKLTNLVQLSGQPPTMVGTPQFYPPLICSLPIYHHVCQSLAVSCLSNSYQIHSFTYFELNVKNHCAEPMYSTHPCPCEVEPQTRSQHLNAVVNKMLPPIGQCSVNNLAAKRFLWWYCNALYSIVIHIWVWSGGDEKSTLVSVVNTLPLHLTWQAILNFCLHLNRTQFYVILKI